MTHYSFLIIKKYWQNITISDKNKYDVDRYEYKDQKLFNDPRVFYVFHCCFWIGKKSLNYGGSSS